jgi:hypothetical protein
VSGCGKWCWNSETYAADFQSRPADYVKPYDSTWDIPNLKWCENDTDRRIVADGEWTCIPCPNGVKSDHSGLGCSTEVSVPSEIDPPAINPIKIVA